MTSEDARTMSQSTSSQLHRARRRTAGHSVLLLAGLTLVVVLAFAAGGVLRSGIDPLAPAGNGETAPASTTASRIEQLQQRLRADPADSAAGIELSAAYLQRARETGDPAYYPRAEAVLSELLRRDPGNAEAMAWTGALKVAQHDFAAGLDWGRRALAAAPELLAAYPVVIDASVELGRYDDAVAAADEFVLLKPDLRSYARIAYLRELYGLQDGAREALRLALDTAREGTEPAAWTRVQLGNLYFSGGQLDAARAEYERTLRALPDYAPALAGLARVAAAEGDMERAADLLLRATAAVPLPEYVILLGDVYAAGGDQVRAGEQYELVRAMAQLQAAAGVNVDLELALFEADHPDGAKTTGQLVADARSVVTQRPSIYARDALAWALYRDGQPDAAWDEMQRALALGTRDALLYFHAGTIALARGDTAGARQQLQTALAINPHFSVLHAPAARAALASLATP
jgi:tetratricopeptide (TPR) repeat protein